MDKIELSKETFAVLVYVEYLKMFMESHNAFPMVICADKDFSIDVYGEGISRIVEGDIKLDIYNMFLNPFKTTFNDIVSFNRSQEEILWDCGSNWRDTLTKPTTNTIF